MKNLLHKDILRYEEILRIIGVAASLGISHIRVTGGEPLVRRGVIDFIASLKVLNGINDISLTTNGVLLADMAQALRDAGITRLNISLDSLDSGKFRRITGSDSCDAVWRGIERAEAIGFTPIKINMVPVKGVNDDEVLDFARLTLDRGIHVRFIELMPIGDGDCRRNEKSVPSGQIREIIERELGKLTPTQANQSAGPSVNYRVNGARGIIGFISPMTKHFCAACRRLRLTADGKIRPCLLSDTEIDLKSPLRSGCDSRELERMLKLALEIKPERHYITQQDQVAGCYTRTMSGIGG
jgi:cyclic pyranopterin phosphate synthase